MLTRLLQTLIRCYQRVVSPCLGDCCRFEPSCSRYAWSCLEHHGAARGSWLALKRILRCNPFFRGGLDLPPLPAHADPKHVEPDWARLDRLVGGLIASAPTHTHPSTPAPNGAIREH